MQSIDKLPLDLAQRIQPAVEAALTPAQLRRVFADVEFKPLGPFAAPEPSIGAAIRLANGGVATLAYGEGSHLLRIDLPRDDSVSAFLAEVRLPVGAITWRRKEITTAARRSTRSVVERDGSDPGDPRPLTVGLGGHDNSVQVIVGSGNVSAGRDVVVVRRDAAKRPAATSKPAASKPPRRKPASKRRRPKD